MKNNKGCRKAFGIPLQTGLPIILGYCGVNNELCYRCEKMKNLTKKKREELTKFMSNFGLYFREDGRIEWQCKDHSIGHTVWYPKGSDSVHGCDGCCGTTTLREMIRELKRFYK